MGKCQNQTPEKKTKKKTKYPCPESIGDQVVPNLGSTTDDDELELLSDDENIDFASCSIVFKSELPSNSTSLEFSTSRRRQIYNKRTKATKVIKDF